MPTSDKLNPQILEEAADWLVEFSSGEAEPSARQRFDTWLRTSPEHVRAYLELLPIWEDGASLPPTEKISAEDLIAMGRSAGANVVPLSSPSHCVDPPLAFHRSRNGGGGVDDPAALAPSPATGPGGIHARGRVRFFAFAACLVLALIGSWLHTQRDTYATGTGEQRSLALEDGSTITLNSRSKVRIRISDDRRLVELIAGQALFQVAKDAARPFIVESSDTEVRAVGTQFDVYRKRGGTIITVVEGRIAVARAPHSRTLPSRTGKREAERSREAPPVRSGEQGGASQAAPGTGDSSPHAERDGSGMVPPAEVFLNAGEQIVIGAAETPHPVRANIAAATAWTQRRLVFDASTLADVVEEFNRYNERALVLTESSLSSFPITAAFSSTDPGSLVRFLEAQPGLEVIASDDEIRISRAR